VQEASSPFLNHAGAGDALLFPIFPQRRRQDKKKGEDPLHLYRRRSKRAPFSSRFSKMPSRFQRPFFSFFLPVEPPVERHSGLKKPFPPPLSLPPHKRKIDCYFLGPPPSSFGVAAQPRHSLLFSLTLFSVPHWRFDALPPRSLANVFFSIPEKRCRKTLP